MSLPAWPNLVEMFFAQAERHANKPFLGHKADGRWVTRSWTEVARDVASLAAGLRTIGVAPGDRVALVSENRPEWAIADLAIMAAGAVSVPAYTTNTARDHRHILENSGAVAAIVSTAKLAAGLMPAVLQSGRCRAVIHIEPVRAGQPGETAFHRWDALIAAHPPAVAAIRAAAAAFGRDDLACIIYTSGTGGAPRGVRFHHGMILHNVVGAADIVLGDFPHVPDRFLSFLPLSHSYEHSAGLFMPIGLGAEIWYAEGIDKLAANIEEVRPTIMIVVPRLFEVMRQRMIRGIEKKGGLAPRLLAAAEAIERRRAGSGRSLVDRITGVVIDRTLRRAARARFGGRLKAMVSGGAPLNPEVGRFFAAMGLVVLQGYGQTESGPIMSCNRPRAGIRMDSVGPPVLGTEVRIAADGEIVCRGELVMHGYWQNPADTATALIDGWLHTGDIGRIDADGHIVITDRKRDIIVNDKGDNIAPQRVQGMLTLQPEIVQAMVYGDRRPHLVALVVADPDWLAEWKRARGEDPAALAKALMAAVDRVNAELSTIEKVRRIVVADAPFTVENEQMTPSLKIRRHVLAAVYGARLDALYGA